MKLKRFAVVGLAVGAVAIAALWVAGGGRPNLKESAVVGPAPEPAPSLSQLLALSPPELDRVALPG